MFIFKIIKKIIQVAIAIFPKKSAKVIEKVEDAIKELPIEKQEVPGPSQPIESDQHQNIPDIIPKPVNSNYCWCIRRGHGMKTKGKRSPMLPSGRQLIEYKFNQDVVRRIIIQLKDRGIEYYEVVPEVLVGNFLFESKERVNNHKTSKPKRYVGIHANAGPVKNQATDWGTFSGIEVWFRAGDQVSEQMAEVFQRHLIQHTGMSDRGIKSKIIGEFFMFRKINKIIPSIITENGFFNNKKEVEILLTDTYRQQVADAHVAAILELEGRALS